MALMILTHDFYQKLSMFHVSREFNGSTYDSLHLYLHIVLTCFLLSFSFCTFLTTSYLFCSYVLSSRKKIMWDINLFNTVVNIPWGNADVGAHNTVCTFHTFVATKMQMIFLFALLMCG